MIDIHFTGNRAPDHLWMTYIRPNSEIRRIDAEQLLRHLDFVSGITIEKESRHVIWDYFRNLPTPAGITRKLYFHGDMAATVLGQILHMILDDEIQMYEVV